MGLTEEIKERKVVVLLLSLVLIVALGSIWLRFRPSAQMKVIHTVFNSMGEVLAQETANAVRAKGTVVAVIDANCEFPGTPANDTWQNFRKELLKHNSINLTTEKVAPDPADGSPAGCPSVVLKELLERHSEASAIVFFVSLPTYEWLQQNGLLPQRMPPTVIVLDTTPQTLKSRYASYLANGILSFMIGVRTGPSPAEGREPQTPREWFDKYYQIYTPQNYESVPE